MASATFYYYLFLGDPVFQNHLESFQSKVVDASGNLCVENLETFVFCFAWMNKIGISGKSQIDQRWSNF